MLLRFDYSPLGPKTWRQASSNRIQFAQPPVVTRLSSAMEQDDVATTTPKPCLAEKRQQQPLSPFSEAAKALLSSPLPPELVVDFKGCNPSACMASQLRNSTSETNVHHPPCAAHANDNGSTAACRTLSDGARKSYARRKLESEDSSYDSDYECSDAISLALTSPLEPFPVPAMSPSLLQQQHEDVSRTVSDTLAAEFNEYVTTACNPQLQKLKEASSDDSDDSEESGALALCTSDPSYSSRVEFALKLGYTEHQVQKALSKLGMQAAQNELLAELIRLASLDGQQSVSSGTGSVGSGEGEHQIAECLRAHRPLSVTNSDEVSLRHIVIDGSNVAVSHGNKEVFSCLGIKLCVDWFRSRGHREITVFVPMWRKETSKIDTPITNKEILLELEKERMLVFTPSRQVGGRRLVCYDDRYVLRLAAEVDGIVVSNDNYRDLVAENPEYRKIVEERILMYSFVNDRFMPPEDPLGRNGPKLDRFLRKTVTSDASAPPCPYGKKCTYGNKCKYYHPERGNVPQKTITEQLAEKAHRQLLEVKARTGGALPQPPTSGRKNLTPSSKTLSLPLSKELGKPPNPIKKTPLARTKSIAPSLTILPPELVEERPTHDAPPIIKSRSDENVTKLLPAARQQQQQPQLHHQHGPLLNAPPPTFAVPPPSVTEPSDRFDVADASANPHRKIQRQLTLNPLNPALDPRLYTLKGLAPPYPPPPFAVHSLVTRNASAPAPASQLCGAPAQQHHLMAGGAAAHMQRLNSTSDTQLNLYGATAAASVPGSQDWALSDPFDEWIKSPPPPFPNQQQHPAPHSWVGRTSSLPGQHHVSSFSDFGNSVGSSQGGNNTEARYKLLFHLKAIFPEEQVRKVMQMMPDETNAQKICAAILDLYPKDQ